MALRRLERHRGEHRAARQHHVHQDSRATRVQPHPVGLAMVITNPRDLHLEGNVRLCLIPVPTFPDMSVDSPAQPGGCWGLR